MSPEQAKGKPVDRRADVWAFGAVLYEMLTGKRAFAGEDVSETLAFVLTKEPDWTALPTEPPEALEKVLRGCLSKDAKRRVRDIGDVLLIMEGAFETTGRRAKERSRTSAWVAVLAAVVTGLVASVSAWKLKPEAPRSLARFVVTPPSSQPLSTTASDLDVAISPDGTRIVYVVRQEGRRILMARSLGRLEATPIAENARGPFFSPDGNWVGYFTGGAVRKVSFLGGPPSRIGPVPGGSGARRKLGSRRS